MSLQTKLICQFRQTRPVYEKKELSHSTNDDTILFLGVLSVQPVNILTQAQFSPISINNPEGRYNVLPFHRAYHFLKKHSDFSGLTLLRGHAAAIWCGHSASLKVRGGGGSPRVLPPVSSTRTLNFQT